MLLFLLAQQLFDQGLVVQRRLQLGVALQRLFVGIHRRGQLVALGQGVAAVVVGDGAVAAGEAFRGGRVVAGAVQRLALPLRITEVLGGLLGFVRLQQALALLVRAQPEVVPAQGVARLWRQAQQQRQAEQPAAASGAGGEQQQRQQQPVALVGPGGQLGRFGALAQLLGAGEQVEALQVAIVQARAAVLATQLAGEAAQAGGVQARYEDGALGILEEAAVLAANRCALSAADTEDGQALAAVAQGAAQAVAFIQAQFAANQQQPATALRTLFQQAQGALHGQVGAAPRLGHDRGFDRFQQVARGGQVVGQRHQHVGAAGVDDDRRLRVAACLQQVDDLALGLFQAVRRGIGGEHRRGQFEQHHQRVGAFLAGLFQALPAGPEQGQQGEQPGQPEGDPRQLVAARAAGGEQHGLKRRRQQQLPAATAPLAVPQLPEQPAEQRQQE